MSPQCSRIERTTLRLHRQDFPRVIRADAGADDRGDVGLRVDQVVQPGDDRLLRADAVVHGLR